MDSNKKGLQVDKDNRVLEDSIKITVIDREDVPHALDAPTDMAMNLMEVCRSYELPVEGICGGMALCASCHCYILSDHELNEPSEDEENMLDQAFFVEDNSRLACQIQMKDSLEGLIAKLAPVD
jgi:2Fe-2S ferredoxin